MTTPANYREMTRPFFETLARHAPVASEAAHARGQFEEALQAILPDIRNPAARERLTDTSRSSYGLLQDLTDPVYGHASLRPPAKLTVRQHVQNGLARVQGKPLYEPRDILGADTRAKLIELATPMEKAGLALENSRNAVRTAFRGLEGSEAGPEFMRRLGGSERHFIQEVERLSSGVHGDNLVSALESRIARTQVLPQLSGMDTGRIVRHSKALGKTAALRAALPEKLAARAEAALQQKIADTAKANASAATGMGALAAAESRLVAEGAKKAAPRAAAGFGMMAYGGGGAIGAIPGLGNFEPKKPATPPAPKPAAFALGARFATPVPEPVALPTSPDASPPPVYIKQAAAVAPAAPVAAPLKAADVMIPPSQFKGDLLEPLAQHASPPPVPAPLGASIAVTRAAAPAAAPVTVTPRVLNATQYADYAANRGMGALASAETAIGQRIAAEAVPALNATPKTGMLDRLRGLGDRLKAKFTAPQLPDGKALAATAVAGELNVAAANLPLTASTGTHYKGDLLVPNAAQAAPSRPPVVPSSPVTIQCATAREARSARARQAILRKAALAPKAVVTAQPILAEAAPVAEVVKKPGFMDKLRGMVAQGKEKLSGLRGKAAASVEAGNLLVASHTAELPGVATTHYKGDPLQVGVQVHVRPPAITTGAPITVTRTAEQARRATERLANKAAQKGMRELASAETSAWARQLQAPQAQAAVAGSLAAPMATAQAASTQSFFSKMGSMAQNHWGKLAIGGAVAVAAVAAVVINSGKHREQELARATGDEQQAGRA